MSLEAVKQVTAAEEQAKEQKAQIVQETKRLVADAEKAGQQLLEETQRAADAEVRKLIAEAEASAANDVDAIGRQTAADAEAMRTKAAERLEEAASLIVRKVVDA